VARDDVGRVVRVDERLQHGALLVDRLARVEALADDSDLDLAPLADELPGDSGRLLRDPVAAVPGDRAALAVEVEDALATLRR
jgi:hypothetical protein